MTDPENGPDDSGSWQPDPTGRYKLRWRDASGDWTQHVYSDDGKMGSDPYDAPFVGDDGMVSFPALTSLHHPSSGQHQYSLVDLLNPSTRISLQNVDGEYIKVG